MNDAIEYHYSSFGPVRVEPVSRIQGLVARAMVKSWTQVPHVTHHELVDIHSAESLRRRLAEQGRKLSLLSLLMKAVCQVLDMYPRFNSSLSEDGKQLIYREYCNLGIATAVDDGLVVPVVHNCEALSVQALADRVSELAAMARGKGLPYESMQGGGFTISSLGGLGGTYFTPLINAPEVAILGVTRTRDVPVKGEQGQIEWHPHLPLSLSYDHRVINGSEAARFCQAIGHILAEPEKLLE